MQMKNKKTGELKTIQLPVGFEFHEDKQLQNEQPRKGWQKMYAINEDEILDGLTGSELKFYLFVIKKLTKNNNDLIGTVTGLAKEHHINRGVMIRHIKKFKEKKLLKGETPHWKINPFIRIPYGANNVTWKALQNEWDII